MRKAWSLFFAVVVLASCVNSNESDTKAYVVTIESELHALEAPISCGHDAFKALSKNIPTGKGNSAVSSYLSTDVRKIVHELSEKSLETDNKCYEVQKRVNSSNLPQDIKAMLSSIAFQHSRFYYCRWRSYETTVGAIDELAGGNPKKYTEMMKEAVALMNEGTTFQVAAALKTKELNEKLKIDQK